MRKSAENSTSPCSLRGSELDVGDGLVGGVQRVDSELSNAVNLRVGAHVAEGLATGEGLRAK